MTSLCPHIIDDDAAVRDALAWLLKAHDIDSVVWSSAGDFLLKSKLPSCGCLILDIRMPGMSGIELFDRIRQHSQDLPVIFLTGHGDVPLAVRAIKEGAFDFLEKPVDEALLIDRVRAALTLCCERANVTAHQQEIRRLLNELTIREREIMDYVLNGKLNKVIADDLGIAMRTVEVHRSRVFEKMGVRSAVELSQVLSSLN
jgi:two-component system response regulator DctR